jgi:hypothetical protein
MCRESTRQTGSEATWPDHLTDGGGHLKQVIARGSCSIVAVLRIKFVYFYFLNTVQ